MMKCNEANELIALYIDNELSGAELKAFEEHLKACEACRHEVEEISQLVRACGELEEEELPEGFAEELHRKLLAAGAKEVEEKKVLQFPAWKIRTFSSVAALFVVVIIAAFLFKDSILSPPKMGGSMADMAAGSKSDAGAAGDQKTGEAASKSIESADDSRVAAVNNEAADSLKLNGAANANEAATNKAVPEVKAADTAKDTENGPVTTAGKAGGKDAKALPKLSAVSGGAAATEKRTAGLTIYAVDTKAAGENIQKLANDNGGEKLIIDMRMMSIAPPEESAAQLTDSSIVLNYLIPNDRYDTFKSAVQKTFGQIGIEAVPLEKQDMRETLDTLTKHSDELAAQIAKAESKEVEVSGDDLASLKEEKVNVDAELKSINAQLNYTLVTVTIMKQ